MKKKVNGASKYFGDPRYEKIWEQMQLLGIDDISSSRQSKNGTITWRLPIKHQHGGQLIEVASFKSGMVRNQNCGYTNYQLNKCKSRDRYFKDYKYTERGTQEFTGKYNKYTCKERILIPIEIDRLEYLISYCLKNYYIKNANLIANGEYIPKWTHEWELKKAKQDTKDNCYNVDNLSVTVNGERYKVI
jgi:hypothetical protein